MRTNWLLLIVLLLALAVPMLDLKRYPMQVLDMALVMTILALSLNLVFGLAGQVSFGHAGFYAIGAYTSAVLTAHLHLPFLVGLAAAAALAGAAGILVGGPALRLKKHYLAFATMGFGEIVRLVILNWPSVTRGQDGIAGIPSPVIFGWKVDSLQEHYYMLLAAVLLTVLITHSIQRSRLGRALAAIREDELAARVAGVDVDYHKILAFCISAALAGIAGSLYAHFITFISPDVFSGELSIGLVAMVMVGGTGTIGGSIIGAILLTLLPEWLRFAKVYYMFFYGVGLVVILIFLPSGVVGALHQLRQRLVPPASSRQEAV